MHEHPLCPWSPLPHLRKIVANSAIQLAKCTHYGFLSAQNSCGVGVVLHFWGVCGWSVGVACVAEAHSENLEPYWQVMHAS